MPATTTPPHEIELIIEKKGGGDGGNVPPSAGRGGGDDGKNSRRGPVSPNRYYTGVAIGIIAILMFFMALASAFLVRRGGSDWAPARIPAVIWFNTAVLIISSGTLELAKGRLAKLDLVGFKKFWILSTVLGLTFLVGQIAAWRTLEAQGVYLASNPASSFFYIFTGAHALHLLGGICALIYVSSRNFDKSKVSRKVAADVTSYYWHFMDALWLFLLALMYLGK
jgi:cytochrome c oxidase subunit III